jgi:5S rRNA maturation endonuclease (ribonuclease M5)
LDFQKIPKLVPIRTKTALKKKVVVLKDKDEEGEKVGWMVKYYMVNFVIIL